MKRILPDIFAICVTLAAALFLVGMFCVFSVDVPYLDQWELVPLLQKAHTGNLSIHDLWAQHNEHRILFPRIIMLAMAIPTHWNIYAELMTNLLLGILIFLVMAVQARHTLRTRHCQGLGWLAAAALLLFSLIQWQNWFLGWQLQVFLSLLTASASLLLLAPAPANGFRWSAAVLMAVIATYSFANGMLVWPIGFLLFLLHIQRPQSSQTRSHLIISLIGWSFAGALTAASYLYHYQTPAYHGSPWAAFTDPLGFLAYMAVYLGQPLAGWSLSAACAAGIAAPLIWAGTIAWLWRRDRQNGPHLLPYLALGLYSVSSAALTAFARSGAEGIAQALSSRYATLANPLWFSIIILTCLAAHHLCTPRGCPPPAEMSPASQTRGCNSLSKNNALREQSIGLWMLGTAFSALVLLSSLYGAYRWSERYAVYAAARAELITGEDQGRLHYLYPDSSVMMERRKVLEQEHWAVFRPHSTP